MKAYLGLALLGLAAPLAAETPPTETWIVTTDLWGNPSYATLTLTRSGERVSGDLDGDAVTGTATARKFAILAKDGQGREYRFSGRVDGQTIIGDADLPDTNDPKARAAHGFTARRIPDRPAGLPRTHDFRPTDYSNSFDPHRRPVLTIWPGDTVRTTTLDSGGVDAQGVTRALFGNPQTGPFFVAGAVPGDTLAIHIRRLRLNRDYADSLDAVVGRALGAAFAAKAGDLGKPVRWTLDRANGRARPDGADGALADYSIPVRPDRKSVV